MDASIYESNIVSAINSDTWYGIFIRNLLNYLLETLKNNILSIISSYSFWATFLIIFFDNLRKIFLTFFFVLKHFYLILVDFILNFLYPTLSYVFKTYLIREKFIKIKIFFKNLLIIGFAPKKANELRNRDIEANKLRVFSFDENNFHEQKNIKYSKVEPCPLEINKNILPSVIYFKNETFKYRYVKKGLNVTKIYYHCAVNRNCIKNCFLTIRKNIDIIDFYVSNKDHNHDLL
jgi:hypothetical protein